MPLRSLLVLFLLASSLGAEDKILLRHHWEPGKVYHYDITWDLESTGARAGGENFSFIFGMDCTVRQDADAALANVVMKLGSLKAMFDEGGKLATYDSADPAMSELQIQQFMQPLMGQALTLVYDKDDAFQRVIVPEGFVIFPQQHGQGPPAELFATLFHEIVEGSLPGQALAPGETFAQDHDIHLMPEASAARKQKGQFDSIVDHQGSPHAKVLTSGTFELTEPSSPNGDPSRNPIPVFKGETLFDLQRKVVTRSTTEMTMKSPGPAGAAVSIKVNASATLKSITDAPAEKK